MLLEQLDIHRQSNNNNNKKKIFNLNLNFTIYGKINSKWISDLNVKPQNF